MLDRAPSDRTADLAALSTRRQGLAPKIERAGVEAARLAIRKRPRRKRKTPDFDSYVAQRNLDALEREAEQLDRAIASAHASQHRRASHLAAHHADRIALDAIDYALAGTQREHVNRTVQQRRIYITESPWVLWRLSILE